VIVLTAAVGRLLRELAGRIAVPSIRHCLRLRLRRHGAIMRAVPVRRLPYRWRTPAHTAKPISRIGLVVTRGAITLDCGHGAVADLIKYMLSDQAGNGNGDDFLIIGLALAGASTRVVTDSPQAGPYNAAQASVIRVALFGTSGRSHRPQR
jgi:hypothetical protein